MRGRIDEQPSLFHTFSVEESGPLDHGAANARFAVVEDDQQLRHRGKPP